MIEGSHLSQVQPRQINMIVGRERSESHGMRHIVRAITADQIPAQIQFNPFGIRAGFSRVAENAEPIVGDFDVDLWPIGPRF